MFYLFFSIVIFLFGLIVGSFLNCLIYRLEINESCLRGKSFCPHCKHILSWQDLIPIFSFIFLKGKCRYCQGKISIQYPLVELATGVLFVLIIYYTFPNFLFSIFYFLLSCFLIIIFVYDLKHYIIPDKIVYPAILIVFFYRIFEVWLFNHWDLQPLLNPLTSAILASAFFLFIVLVSRGQWMGVGDIKLAFLMGLVLGWPAISVALFSAFFIGAVVGIGLIISNKKTLKSEIPFGPFLVTGTFLVLFWGNDLINWYLGMGGYFW